MRYAAYIRISSEDQVGNFSIDAQKRGIQTWVTAQNGILVKTYVDEAQSGRSIDRPAFQKMRREARKNKFDALVVHKFDRFARNRTDALAIKSLLRHDYGIKVFSVSEPSEDSDGPIGALIEGIMESVADWYSKNLATETAKGKKERSAQGLHNNQAPFGMKKDKKHRLSAHEHQLPGLQLAFESYATGNHSDNEIAGLLNDKGYRTKTDRPFSKETVRFMLQNRTYLGKIRYQKTAYKSDGSRSRTGPIEWLEGKHEPVIDAGLFEQCAIVRGKRRSHRQPTTKFRPYLLRGMVYCQLCCANPPEGKTFKVFGKMRAQSHGNGKAYYRCRAHEMGYPKCQGAIRADSVDDQVLTVLMGLTPPKGWRSDITTSVGELLGEKNLDQRLAEINETIRRMDTRWDNGFFVDEQEYFTQRLKLQGEMEELMPVEKDDLEDAADLLINFGAHYQDCGGDVEAEHELVKRIVERVYIKDKEVKAMTLRSNYHLVMGHNVNGPTEYTVDPFLSEDPDDITGYASGDDGI